MSFEIKDKDLAGRIGKLKTKSGVLETPVFFPVINPLKQEREVPISELKRIGFKQVITNAYIIKKNYGDRALSVGVHKLIDFDGVVMTDSGAYQLLIYGGNKVHIDPLDIVVYQERLGSDIAVIADVPTRDDSSYEEALMSVKETIRRAQMVEELISNSETLWVLPIQGGIYLDLVKYSALEATKLSSYSTICLLISLSIRW